VIIIPSALYQVLTPASSKPFSHNITPISNHTPLRVDSYDTRPIAATPSPTATTNTPDNAFIANPATQPMRVPPTPPLIPVIQVKRNWIYSAFGINGPVIGVFSRNCSSSVAPPPGIWIDSCMDEFIGHNPGAFSGLMRVGIGSEIDTWDNAGVKFVFHVTTINDTTRRADGTYVIPDRTGTIMLQTCMTQDASTIRLVQAS
jgi:hypothetical protein